MWVINIIPISIILMLSRGSSSLPSDQESEPPNARYGGNFGGIFNKAKTQAEQLTVLETFVSTSTVFFPLCSVHIVTTFIPRFCAIVDLRKQRQDDSIFNPTKNFNVSLNTSNLNSIGSFPVYLESSMESSPIMMENEMISSEPDNESGGSSKVVKYAVEELKGSIEVLDVSSVILDIELESSLLSSTKVTDSVTDTLKTIFISVPDQSKSSSKIELESSILISAKPPDMTPPGIPTEINANFPNTTKKVLKKPILMPQSSNDDKVLRFLKVIVKETWTSRVTQVINSVVFVTQFDTRVITTITYRSTSINTIRVGGTVLPLDLFEC